MIVYAQRTTRLRIVTFVCDLERRIDRLPALPSHDAIVDLLVDFGEVYAAVADTLSPAQDDDPPALSAWSAVAQALSRALAASWHRDSTEVGKAIAECRRRAAALRSTEVGRSVSVSTAEGFAFHALCPVQYVVAAERVVAKRKPASLTCIGIRTIGAPLAHVVAAAAERQGVATQVLTVRPRGHPFDRRLALSERFRQRVIAAVGDFAIVDEGPGLSGSSFAAVSEALLGLGIRSERIILFPSWDAPAAALRSPRGQAAAHRHARAVARFEEVRSVDGLDDVSAGAWRPRVIGSDERRWPAVHPQHERRKYLMSSQAEDAPRIMRFAGFGRHGLAKRERAVALAEAGFVARPLALTGGFLVQEWVRGRPVDSQMPVCTAILDRLVEYLSFLHDRFRTGKRARVDDLARMAAANAAEAALPVCIPLIDRLAADATHFDEPQVALDGRMLPHEWIVPQGGVAMKMDSLDHHADDFCPGSRDVAWDVAGALVEFALDGEAGRYLIASYRDRSRDTTIASRIPFYRAAYLGYRIGYAALAVESLGDTADSARFKVLLRGYRRSLQELAAGRHPVPEA